MLTPVQRFDDHLTTLGIPIHGVRGSGPTCEIDFKIDATEQQREAARSARGSFDWSNWQRKTVREVLPDVPTLTAEQRQMVLTRVIASYLADHPSLARDVGINPFYKPS